VFPIIALVIHSLKLIISDVHLEADVLLIAALLQDVQIDEFPARD